MSKKTDTKPVRLSEVDFLIATYDNRPGLERLLRSLLEKYPVAKITIGDSSDHLDRAYYKSLRSELAEDGLANRVIIHHLAYKAQPGQIFNELISRTSNKYKLLLTDEDLITDKTDVEAMIRVMRSNKTIGVVGGVINKAKKAEGDSKAMRTDEGDVFNEVKFIERFMMIYKDAAHALRFDTKSDDFAIDFSNKAKTRLPFKMVMSKSVITSNNEYDNEESDEQSDGNSGGADASSDVQTEAGGSDTEGGSDDTSSSSRENETSEDPAVSRRSRRGGARSVPGEND